MSYRYPYGNTEQMNLDWFLKQWEAFKADWAEAEAGIDGSLDAEIAKVEAAMSELYAARDAAAASATAARQSSLDAAAAQVAAGNSKTAAQAAETSARGSQQAAAESAQEAQASATGAENSALTATQAANTATQQAAGADAAKGAAEAAQQAAEAAQQAAEAAQAAAAQSAGQAGQAATAAGDHADDAADSATLAQQAAQDMSDSVEQITTNKNDISDLKESIVYTLVDTSADKLSLGRINATNGNVSISETSFYHIEIPVSEGDLIYFYSCITGNTSVYGYAFYDENDTYLEGTVVSQEVYTMAVAPKNATKFKYGMATANWSIEKYNTIAKLTNYSTILLNNIVTENVEIYENINTDSNDLFLGRINANTGAEQTNAQNFYHVRIPVSEGDLIYFYSCLTGNGAGFGYAFYDSNGSYISGVEVNKEQYMVAIAPPNAKLFKYGMYVTNWGMEKYNTIKKISGYVKTMLDNITGTTYSNYKWNAVGDSITYKGYYLTEVNNILGIRYANCGVSSSTIAVNDTYMQGRSMVELVTAGTYGDADIWTVMGGLNDCLYSSNLGSLAPVGSTYDTSTVYGALQTICEYILNLRAQARLILITPTQSVRDSWNIETYPCTIALIRKAILDVGEYYSIPVFDAWAEGGISAYNIQKLTNPTTSDGVHLNTLGADIFGEKLALRIKDVLFGIDS